MWARKFLLLVARTGGIAVPYSFLWLARGQTPSQPRSDAPYHATDMSKPQGGSTSISKQNPAPASSARKSSLIGLTKIAILPSSISIAGPHYSQRLLVEGTFADGQQEELTSRA